MKDNNLYNCINLQGNIEFVDLSANDIRYQLSNLRHLTFEVTDACNLKCKYCGYGEFYSDYDKRENKMLSMEKAIRLLEYLAELWNSNMNISKDRHVYISFYGGEPLLNMPFIATIVDYVENRLKCPHRHFSFSMTTNAILLNRYADFLTKHRFNLLISLDGNDANSAYRVDNNNKPAFDSIVSNINLLRNKYPEYFEKYVNFNAVLHNKNSVEEIYRFFKDQYNKIPSIGELNNTGIKPEQQKKFMATYRNVGESLHQSEHYDEIERDMFIRSGSYQTVTTFLHQYSGFVFRNYNDLFFEQQGIKTLPTGTCIPFSKKMFVTVNGKILPCERIGHQHALGEITDTGIQLDFEKIAKKYNQYYSKIKEQCIYCFIKRSCIQCIFNLEDLETSCRCRGFTNEQSFRNYVNSQLHFLSQHPEDYYRIMEEVIVE